MGQDLKLQAIVEATQMITSSIHLDDILKSLMTELLSVIEAADAVIIFLYDEENGKLVPRKAHGFRMEYLEHVHLDPGEAMSGRTFVEQKEGIYQNKADIKTAMDNLQPDKRMWFQKSLFFKGSSAESAISAPLIYKDHCIGAMTVDSFSENIHFTQEDLETLVVITNHAAVAIENARLYEKQKRYVSDVELLHQEVQQKNKKLKNAMDIHKKLTKITLTGMGVDEVCRTVASLLNKEIILFDDFSQILSRGKPANSPEPTLSDSFIKKMVPTLHKLGQKREVAFLGLEGHHFYAKSITANQALLGILMVYPMNDDSHNELAQMATELATTVFALELMKEETIRETRLRIMGNMLEDLIEGKEDSALLDRLKMTTEGTAKSAYCMFSVKIDGISKQYLEERYHEKKQLFRVIQKVLHKLFPDAIILEKNEAFFILVAFDYQIETSEAYSKIEEVLRLCRSEIKVRGLFLTISSGIGRIVAQPSDIRESYQDAQLCLEYIKSTEIRNYDAIYEQLGVNRLFFKNDTAELKRYVYDIIGEIIEYDKKNESDLILTLKTYLGADKRNQTTADKLNIHINTLYYRIKKIEELLSVRKGFKPLWIQVQLAVEVYNFLKLY